jgi:hypothetical protein
MYYEDPYPKQNVGCIGLIVQYIAEMAALGVGVFLFLLCLGIVSGTTEALMGMFK